MRIPIFMILSFVHVITSWARKALEDGKVSAQEGLELVIMLADVLGVHTDFNISDYFPEAVDIKEK